MKVAAAIIICACVIAGCATVNQQEPEVISPPGDLPEDLEGFVRDYLQKTLKDPDSLRDLEFVGDPKIWTNLAFHRQSGLKRGDQVWVVEMKFNHKNQFGAYVGLGTHWIWIRNQEVVHFV